MLRGGGAHMGTDGKASLPLVHPQSSSRGSQPPCMVPQERSLGRGHLHTDRPPAWILYHPEQRGPGGEKGGGLWQEGMLFTGRTDKLIPPPFFSLHETDIHNL
ncbi:hypothetical protein CgunFtcFv8_018047 [Champsocephalus gunnari]|uniref:Uncharacterized protein n=1 Tax=Champsocephalus gunnari TaxID=52237 RepID=A0AAN8DME6_CHAGU|nr:hypothetical protein CgunFtcFv8_018047 [Champsocephalus gunnari]